MHPRQATILSKARGLTEKLAQDVWAADEKKQYALISYAYPSSPMAKALGKDKEGTWALEITPDYNAGGKNSTSKTRLRNTKPYASLEAALAAAKKDGLELAKDSKR